MACAYGVEILQSLSNRRKRATSVVELVSGSRNAVKPFGVVGDRADLLTE